MADFEPLTLVLAVGGGALLLTVLALVFFRPGGKPIAQVVAEANAPFALDATYTEAGKHTLWLRYDVAFHSPFKQRFGFALRLTVGGEPFIAGVGRNDTVEPRIGLTRYNVIDSAQFHAQQSVSTIAVCALPEGPAGTTVRIEGTVEPDDKTTVRGLTFWVSRG